MTKNEVEPMEFFVPLKDVKDSVKEDCFSITSYKDGIEYSVFNNYRIFVNKDNNALYNALLLLLKIHKGEYDKNDEDVVNYSLGFSIAMNKILQLPILAASDQNLMISVYDVINNYLKKMQDIILNSELKEDENPELTKSMQDAYIASNELADNLKEASKQIK